MLSDGAGRRALFQPYSACCSQQLHDKGRRYHPVQSRAPCLATAYKFVEQLVFQALLYVEPMPIGDVLDYYDQSSIFEINFHSREGDFMLLKKLNCSQVFVSPIAEAVSQLQVVDQGPYGALPPTLACPATLQPFTLSLRFFLEQS